MAVPTTLLEVAVADQAAIAAERAAARADLDSAQKTLAAKEADRDARADELAKLEARAAEIRRQLAVTEMPADAQKLVEELEQNIIESRSKHALILDAEAAIESARRTVAVAGAELDRATADLAAATAALETAQAGDRDRRDMIGSLGQPPLKDVKSRASSALGANAQPRKAAEDRLKNDIPDELRNRALDRRAKARADLALVEDVAEAAEDELAGERNSHGGVAGKASKQALLYARAEARFLDYAAHAQERFERAISLLEGVRDAPPLTTAELARIKDATIVANGKAAVSKEKDRDDKRADVEAARADVDKERLKALASDPDKDPDQNAQVQAKLAAVTTAEGHLQTAEGNYTDQMEKDLNLWEATVPDRAWRLLADFEEATTLLTVLKNTDPGTAAGGLAKQMTEQEAALVSARNDTSRSELAQRVLAAAGRRHDQRLAVATGLAQVRLFAAMRGDRS